jgi:quercetin dioxygenase-like cupin family protein
LSHDQQADIYRALALSYALGILGAEEMSQFEKHLSDGCTDCDREVQSVNEIVATVAAGTSVVPPAALRQELMRRVAKATLLRAEKTSLQIVRSAGLPWKPVGTGLWEKSLFVDASRSRKARLIRMEPGSRIPAHRHLQDEESLVLEGRGAIGDLLLGPGDYHRAPSGSSHPSYSSAEGCVFLLFSATEYEFFSDDRGVEGSQQLISVNSGTRDWRPLRPGVQVKTLFAGESPQLAQSTALLRVRPRTSDSVFGDLGVFEAFVLEGDAELDSQLLAQGDYCVDVSGEPLSHFISDLGCLMLIHSRSNPHPV